MKWAVLLLSLLFLAPARADELTISAAASLKEAVSEIGARFQKTYPETALTFNFGSSGTLQKQIENGAPVDVFLAASTKNTKALQSQNLIEKPQIFTRGELVLIAPRDSKLNQLSDLKSPNVRRIAIGGRGVPAGNYAQQVLKFYGLNLSEKLVLAKDVRAVLAQVAAGNVNAGFVYRTDALTSTDVKIVKSVNARAHQPIVYPLAVVKASKNPAGARRFATFARSDAARAILKRRGFLVKGQ